MHRGWIAVFGSGDGRRYGAAGLKAPPRPLPPPVYFTWTGCYVGAHVGGLWASKEFVETTPDSKFVGLSAGTHEVDSWLGGLQVGCDYHFAGGFVVGIQGD
jgi:outer membrane immunogenic protein